MTLLGTTKGFAVLDHKYEVIEYSEYCLLFGDEYDGKSSLSLCFEHDYKKDGNAFFISFNHGETISQEIRSANSYGGDQQIGNEEEA